MTMVDPFLRDNLRPGHGIGAFPERRPRGGSTAGWHKRKRCSLCMAAVWVMMLSPSIQSRAHIWRFPMTCLRSPSLRKRQFHGQVGTTSCEPGGCRSVRLRSFGADGRTSRRLPDMPTPKKGSDAERLRGTLKLTRRRKCGMPNVGVRRCSRLARCSSAFAKRATTSSTLVAPLRRRYHFARRSHTLKISPTSPVRGVGMTTGRLQTRPDPQNAGTNI